MPQSVSADCGRVRKDPHPGPLREGKGVSRSNDASEGEFGAVIGQTVSPDRVDVVATLCGELNPDAWPVEAHVVSPIAQVRRTGVGHFDLIEPRPRRA